MLFVLLGLHAALGVAVLTRAGTLGRRGLLVGGLAPLATLVWVVAVAPAVLDGTARTGSAEWVGDLGLTIDLRLDAFAVLMTVLISGIGSLVFVYAWFYLEGSERAGRLAGLLTLFAGSMFGLVVADNLFVLYVCWELTSVTSYLLIGLDDHDEGARGAALHALVVTSFGGLAMLGGFVVLGRESGTFRLSEMLENPPSGVATSVALVLILLGALTKSAQYPFHSWLPGAMVAPTPISAYLHSAAMVKAGVYLIARFAPAFADAGPWRPVVVTAGLVTMIAGGLRAFRPHDLKQLLAFGTISQLGLLTVLLGIGIPEATAAGCALLLAHGAFKAALFMIVGVVDHQAGTRDLRHLPVLRRGWGLTRAAALVSAGSMAALPPLAGFIAKEEAFASLVHGSSLDRLVLAGVVGGSVLTVAYSLRFAVSLVHPPLVGGHPGPRPSARPPDARFVLPAVLLAIATLLAGLVPGTWSHIVDAAAHALDAEAAVHLSLWHGVNWPLVLSGVTLGGGALLFAARHRVAAWQERLAPPVSGLAAYQALVRGLLHVAARVTGVLQSGSLPVYLAVIMSTAAVATTATMLAGPWWSGWPAVLGQPAHLAVVALVLGGALGATVATRRFVAAILLGVVGYGMALLFVLHGAPDLALTQFCVETLSVVVFLLVLRRLPDRFERRRSGVAPPVRLAVAAGVGVFVTLMALAASTARQADPVSREMSAEALPKGHGRNVVNVILVDIRGLDTLGEITVLVVAAIGITALARVGRQPRPHTRVRITRRARRAEVPR